LYVTKKADQFEIMYHVCLKRSFNASLIKQQHLLLERVNIVFRFLFLFVLMISNINFMFENNLRNLYDFSAFFFSQFVKKMLQSIY